MSSTRYLRTVTNRLSAVAVQRGDAPVERPAVLRADIRVVLQALRDSEQKIVELSKAPAISGHSTDELYDEADEAREHINEGREEMDASLRERA